MSSVSTPFSTPLSEYLDTCDERLTINKAYEAWKKTTDSDFSDMPAHMCQNHHVLMKWDKRPRKFRHCMIVRYPASEHLRDWHHNQEGETANSWIEDRFDCNIREIIEENNYSFALWYKNGKLRYLYEGE